MNAVIRELEKSALKAEVAAFSVGDTVRVAVEIVEGEKTRLQAFEGVVIARKGAGPRETFTIRRIASGVGVERTFLIHSPRVADIQLVRRGKVRRAKLYYLRRKVGKKARVKEGRMFAPRPGQAVAEEPAADS